MIIGGFNGLPKSCVKVLDNLNSASCEGLSQEQLRNKTGLSDRAVKYALKTLAQKRLAFYRIVLDDTRRRLYYKEVVE